MLQTDTTKVPHTLLLADDSATIQRVIELTFADEDVTVVAVGDGDQAIAQIEASAPDIVLADIGMPGKNGYDVAQYIRQSPALSHIPVVLLSGAFEPVDPTRADDAHCDGVLAKPFEPQMVIGRVKELLARPRKAPNAAEPATEVAPPEPAGGERAEHRDVSPSQLPSVIDQSHYFDQLDAAFSMLRSNTPLEPEPTVVAMAESSQAPADIDVFDHATADSHAVEPWDDMSAASSEAQDAVDLPLVHEPEQPESSLDVQDSVVSQVSSPVEAAAVSVPVEAQDDRLAPIEESQPVDAEPVSATPPVQSTEPPKPKLSAPQPVALPALADAFAALLAAEQREPASARSGSWASTAVPSAETREELVEEVVRRVLDRLSGTVRETVSEIALQAAERLIREEIERIKASIK